MIIEKLKGEKLKSYYPNFLDIRTGKSEKANYKVSLFPSEVLEKETMQSKGNIVVSYTEN
jgi:hypothetical protein